MNKNKLLIIGAIIIGLGIGTIIGLQQIKNSETTTTQEKNNQEETISQRLTPEQALAEYNQTRTSEQRKEAIENIKAIFGEDLEVTFKEAITRYYSCGIPNPAGITDFVQLKVIEIYKDNKNFTTEVDTETNEILKREKSCTQETQWIALDQAKKTARNLLAKIVDDPENYELVSEDTWKKTYHAFWRKMNEGKFYSKIPGGKKGQYLSRAEDRFITICLLNGELMSYEYNFALTEEEVTEMAENWEATQKKDIEAIRKFLGNPEAIFTFVNWGNEGTKVERIETDEGTIMTPKDYKSVRIYKNESGKYYRVDDEGNVYLGRMP